MLAQKQADEERNMSYSNLSEEKGEVYRSAYTIAVFGGEIVVLSDLEAALLVLVLATNPSLVKTVRTSALLTGLVRTALNTVPSSVIDVRS